MSWLASGTGPVTHVEATELLQAVVGESFPAVVVSAGGVVLPFSQDVAIGVEGRLRPDEGPGDDAPEAHTLDGLALLLPLLGAEVTAATAHDGGGLTLVTVAGTLHCPGDLYYEPWNLTVEDGRQLTSTPGGGYVVTD